MRRRRAPSQAWDMHTTVGETRRRRIHPSATLFVAILLAFALPFGHAVESCGSSSFDATGVEILTKTVHANPESRAYASEIEDNAVVPAWLMVAAAIAGLLLAALAGGRLTSLAGAVGLFFTLYLGVAMELAEAYVGYELVLLLFGVAMLLPLFAAIARAIERRVGRRRAARREAAVGGVGGDAASA